MEISFKLLGWCALYPGARAPEDRFLETGIIDPNAPVPKSTKIPMLTARRLTTGNRCAIECALTLIEKHAPRAMLFSSRHSELEHNFKLLKALAEGVDTSPTDFTMSVHNSAAGVLSILSKLQVATSAASAGADGLSSLLTEAYLMVQEGKGPVLAVDFEGAVPAFYRPYLKEGMPAYPYAAALMLDKGAGFKVKIDYAPSEDEPRLAPALSLYRALSQHEEGFTIQGGREKLEFCCEVPGESV